MELKVSTQQTVGGQWHAWLNDDRGLMVIGQRSENEAIGSAIVQYGAFVSFPITVDHIEEPVPEMP